MTDAVTSLRAFNRFHTRFVGAFGGHYMGSDLSLTEARTLYEINTRQSPLASEIQAALAIDAGYLSRILRKFEARGWIARGRGADARQRPIEPTEAGHTFFTALDARTKAEVERSLAHLCAADRERLAGALDHVRHTLDTDSPSRGFAIRTWRAGDMGLIAARQAILYDQVYGWGTLMELMIGEITTQFLRDAANPRQQCWVAEQDGEMAGSVFVVEAAGEENVAQLRLLYTEAWARGLGIGEALVRQCVDFARTAGYREMMLWTHTKLTSARKIYEGVGFRIRSVEIHDEFGQPEQGETWAMALD